MKGFVQGISALWKGSNPRNPQLGLGADNLLRIAEGSEVLCFGRFAGKARSTCISVLGSYEILVRPAKVAFQRMWVKATGVLDHETMEGPSNVVWKKLEPWSPRVPASEASFDADQCIESCSKALSVPQSYVSGSDVAYPGLH